MGIYEKSESAPFSRILAPAVRVLDSGERYGSSEAPADARDTHTLPARANGKIFDVDGVLTNPIDKRVSDELIGRIRASLLEGDFISFNTGRSVPWVIDHVLRPLAESGLSAEFLSRICAVAEKGSCWIEWRNGTFEYFRSSTLNIPDVARARLTEVVEQLGEQVFEIDRSKMGIFTVEFKPVAEDTVERDYELFQVKKVELAKLLEQEMKSIGLEGVTVDVTAIAIDVQHEQLGKGLGAARIAEFYGRRGLTLEKVICFGDSRSDLEMASELLRKGINTHYIHVGDGKALTGIEGISRVTAADAPLYDQATVRVLNLARELREPPKTNAEMFACMTRYESLLPSMSPWYDKRFFSAQEIRIDQSNKVIDVFVSGVDTPIYLGNPQQPELSVPGISKQYQEGKIEDISDDQGVRRLIAHDARILFSSGSYVIRGEPGEESVLILERSLDAPVAPGLLQGAAGRCDRPIGVSAHVESLEELVCIAEHNGSLGYIGMADQYGEHGEGMIFDARWRAIQGLRAKTRSLGDSPAGEQAQQRLELLETTTDIHPAMLVPYDDGKNFYRVRTWIGDSCVEDIGGVHLAFDTRSNTAEFRRAFHLADPTLEIKVLEDGDGFGRTVRFMSRAELSERWQKIHPPSQQFLSEVLKINAPVS